MPLTAFDRTGTRLGTGFGYYDKTFAFTKNQPLYTKPKLYGLAYAFQEIRNIPRMQWDVPMHGVITEQGVISLT